MLSIRNIRDLRIAYELIYYCIDGKKHPDKIADLKRKIRAYNKKKNNERKFINGTDDYYVELITMPEWIKSFDDAEYYFNENIVLKYIPSQYDCTGQLFTCRYKIVKRNERFICYHFVSIDV